MTGKWRKKRTVFLTVTFLCVSGMTVPVSGREVYPGTGYTDRQEYQAVNAEEKDSLPYRTEGNQEKGIDAEEGLQHMAEEYLDFSEIEQNLQQENETEEFSFRETFYALLCGDISFDLNAVFSWLLELFLKEFRQLRTLVVQILIAAFAGAVFSNFVQVFENSQIADISFYMIYILVSAFLVQAFAVMNQITLDACQAILDFMKVLLPSYLVTVVLSAGSVSALGFYEVTVLTLNIVQVLLVRLLIPGIHFYLIVLILNQIAQEDYFSKFAQLLELAADWSIKSMLGTAIGLQAVQCLVTPAVDSLKQSSVQRLAKAIPGIGGALDAASETVAGSAVILKNAVGVTGMIALAVICAVPVVKLAAGILMFRILCALIQPICARRIVDGIESVARGTALLLRVLIAGVSVFLISLAMITAAVGGKL